jgi:hypothetical protein
MFNTLYQVEQAGRQQQQALLDVQRQAEQARAAPRMPRTAGQRARHTIAQSIRGVISATVHPRSAAGWLTRLLVLVAACAYSAQSQPAAAAAAIGDPTSAGTQSVVDPFNAGSFNPIQDPGNAGSFSPVQDPANAGSFSPVIVAERPGAHPTFPRWLLLVLTGLAGIGGMLQRRRPSPA